VDFDLGGGDFLTRPDNVFPLISNLKNFSNYSPGAFRVLTPGTYDITFNYSPTLENVVVATTDYAAFGIRVLVNANIISEYVLSYVPSLTTSLVSGFVSKALVATLEFGDILEFVVHSTFVGAASLHSNVFDFSASAIGGTL